MARLLADSKHLLDMSGIAAYYYTHCLLTSRQ